MTRYIFFLIVRVSDIHCAPHSLSRSRPAPRGKDFTRAAALNPNENVPKFDPPGIFLFLGNPSSTWSSFSSLTPVDDVNGLFEEMVG